MDAQILYNRGISFEEFVNKDKGIYKEKTLEIFNSIEFDTELVEKIRNIDKTINILICAELWCPDCMINVPVVEKIRQINTNINLSIVGREGNEEFFRRFSETDSVRIPTFVFYDSDFNELGSFVEHPKKLRSIMEKGSQPNIIVAKRKYRKGEYAEETLKDIIKIIC